ncbi:hypothetical protein NQT62_05800 [Limnobacter humi]|uniref:DNA polymerase III subunit delta n=1 Tax=Limnobacter humi TaxID=1778671 RepID=A0ABT1WEK0_9BURK|nr:hypothetical protein [Limnobacter humi]MCQ8895952.1 hypothetical protein [Limnobacter humi]
MNAPWLHRAALQFNQLIDATTAPILLHGHQARGLYDLVHAQLGALLCEAASRTALKPCGQCPACHMRASNGHPDLRLLMPQAVAIDLGFPLDIKGSAKPSGDIRIDDVRDLQSYFTTASSRGADRYVVVYPFDAMNTNTANALLKTLEEPPRGLRFVLVGNRVDNLLPTIRSRCQSLHVPQPNPSECIAWLQEQGIQAPEVALSVAMNDPFEASNLAIAQPDQLELRRKLLEWLANPDQHAWVPAGLEKAGLAAVLELSMRLCHDCIHIAHGLKADYFGWLAPKLLWAKQVPTHQWSLLYNSLQREFHLAHHPINPRLALEFVGQQWQTLNQ